MVFKVVDVLVDHVEIVGILCDYLRFGVHLRRVILLSWLSQILRVDRLKCAFLCAQHYIELGLMFVSDLLVQGEVATGVNVCRG
jgi:hypothetical protein